MIAKDAGYGDPEYTNMLEIDYKFYDDADFERTVIIMARKIASLEKDLALQKRIVASFHR